MVGHSYSQLCEVKWIFKPVDHPVDWFSRVFYFEGVLNQKYHKLKFENKITFWNFDHWFGFKIENRKLIGHSGNKGIIGHMKIKFGIHTFELQHLKWDHWKWISFIQDLPLKVWCPNFLWSPKSRNISATDSRSLQSGLGF